MHIARITPVEDYDELSLRVISYVDGLPLALKIIGSFLNGKDKIEWNSALEKLKDIPNSKVMEQLKISYDGLDRNERELFLDIACFFRGKSKEEAMEILDACGFHPRIGVKVLIQKSLITISEYGKFDMHDLVQEMGHHIIRGEHPNNPEKHSRVWRKEDIEDILCRNATMENHTIEGILDFDRSPSFNMLVPNLKRLRFLSVDWYWGKHAEPAFLSNELKHMRWYGYPASLFPKSFQPRKLVVLKIESTLQKELWKGYKHLPCLEELELIAGSLVKTPDFTSLPRLQKLTLKHCESLEEIDPSLGYHTSLAYVSVRNCTKLTRFPTIVRMKKLEILKISDCKALLEIPQIKANMDSLLNLHLNKVGIEGLPSSVHPNLPCLKELELTGANALVRTPDFGGLPCLQKLTLDDCDSLEEIDPSVGHHTSLGYLYVRKCKKLTRFRTIVRMEKLEIFKVIYCTALLEFPKIEANMNRLENLDLECVGIEVLSSSIGRYCTNLISRRLVGCCNLKTIEGNFHALKRLQKFVLDGGTQLEKLPKDLFDVKCSLQELVLNLSYGKLNTFSPIPPHLPRLLRNLDLSWCELKDGDIPREIEELSSLKELHLNWNHFSRVDISLSKLTQLKLLSLDYCYNLVELPELPSNLAILKANMCKSLEAIGDDICTLQKELWKGKKYMPYLKELEIIDAKALVRTPDFGGLSCLQKLIIKQCESLEEIHQSLGNHTSLVYIYVQRCPKLTRFPTIVRMEKLEILKLSGCTALLEFPKIEANMDRLENLDLEYVGIEVLPSSIGRYCTNLISLRLVECRNLKSIEGNVHALKRLQKFELCGKRKLEELPEDLFNVECCIEDLYVSLVYNDSNYIPPYPPPLSRVHSNLGSYCRI